MGHNGVRVVIKRRLLYFILFLYYLLHQDFWNFRNDRLLVGIPVGLLYHILYCLGATLLLYWTVLWAWPEQLDRDERRREEP